MQINGQPHCMEGTGGLLTGETYQDPPSPTLPLNCLWCTCKIAQTQYDVIFSTPDSTSSDNQSLFLEAWQSSVNSAVADLGFWKGGFQFASDWSHKAREAHALGGCGTWGTCPPRKIYVSDLLRSLLVPFWGETARVRQPTANLVIVFETFKRLHNLKALLRFAPRHGKIFFS